MILVIDSNILLSAMIRDSDTRKIILESGWSFYYPEISFHEIRKYKALVLEKSRISEEEYNQLLGLLLKHITLVPTEMFLNNLKEADEIMGKIDPDDVVFLAVAMSLSNSEIWSHDSHFQRQNKIKVLRTEDIVKLF